MKTAAGDRAREQSELLLRQEQLAVLRKSVRLRCFKGIPGVLLSGTSANNGGTTTYDLGTHIWVIRVQCNFDGPPGKYRLEYVCDMDGRYQTVGAVPEAEWILISAGESTVVSTLTRRRLATTEDTTLTYPEQAALFLRFLRVVSDDGAAVSSWAVYEDDYLDLSDRVMSLSPRRSSDIREVDRVERPTMDFSLADDDGRLRARSGTPLSPPMERGERPKNYFDDSGLTWLRGGARWYLEVALHGENWSNPAGFEGSGFWPIYSGYQQMRDYGRSVTQGRSVQVTTKAGKKALDQVTTQPLLEQQDPIEFLRDRLTVSDDGKQRLMGFYSRREMGAQTMEDEIVGKTKLFGDNWWGELLNVDATVERIHSVAGSEQYLFVLTYTEKIRDDGTPGGFDESYWSLVKFDFNGNEIERIAFAWGNMQGGPIGHARPPIEKPLDGDTLCCDLVVRGESVYVSYARRSIGGGLYAGAPYHDGRLLVFDADIIANGIAQEMSLEPVSGKELLPTAMIPIDSGLLEGGFAVWVQLLNEGVDGNEPETPGDEPISRLQFYDANFQYKGRYPTDYDFGLIRSLFGTSMEQGSANILFLHGGYVNSLSGPDLESKSLWGWDINITSLSPFTVLMSNKGPMTTEYTYAGLLVQGDFVLAGGFGPEARQQVAKVGRLGWYLENSALRSSAAGDRAVNFAEPEIKIGTDELTVDVDYSLDRTLGHLMLLTLPENGQRVLASYDYSPKFSLVPITEEERWEVAQELCLGMDLRLSIDAVDRLTVEPWQFEEYVRPGRNVQLPTAGWRLGESVDESGVGWVIPETVTVRNARSFEEISSEFWELTEVSGSEHGEAVMKYEFNRLSGFPTETISETPTAVPILISFAVQRFVPVLDGRVVKEGGRMDAAAVITEAVVKGVKRFPSDFPQRLAKTFAVADKQERVKGSFNRIQPVEGLRRYDFLPEERIFERSSDTERPLVHVEFKDPLILGSSKWGVVAGKPPYGSGTERVIQSGSPNRRFVEITLTETVSNDGYEVWVGSPGSFRIATEADFPNMNADTMGIGGGSPPSSADDVKTTSHFYLYLMNGLSLNKTEWLAYHTETRYFAQDSRGRVRSATENDDEQKFVSAYADKAVRVLLTPQDENGVALQMDPPAGDAAQRLIWSHARVVVEECEIMPDGIRMTIANDSGRQYFVGVEVIGYPALTVEHFEGSVKSADGVAAYGEQEKSFDSRFLINDRIGKQIAARIVSLRGIEPEEITLERSFSPMLMEGDYAQVTVDSETLLLKVITVKSSVEPGGSGSTVSVVR